MSIPCTISVYIESKTSLLEKINAIELIIDAMLIKIAESVDGKDITVQEYWMDDGQMKVKTSYRSTDDIFGSMKKLEKMKQIYVNKYNGRSFVLRDVRGINHY